MISFVCHILDDFLIIEPPAPTVPLDSLCQSSLCSMILSFKNINIPISAAKTEGPCKVPQFMGIILDSHKMEARLPVDKVERIKTALWEFRSKRLTTLQELQSLIGTFNFGCKVIPPGRPFLQCMIALTRGVKKPHHHNWFFQRPRYVELVYWAVEWYWAVLIFPLGHLWDPLPIHKFLWLHWLWGILSN